MVSKVGVCHPPSIPLEVLDMPLVNRWPSPSPSPPSTNTSPTPRLPLTFWWQPLPLNFDALTPPSLPPLPQVLDLPLHNIYSTSTL